MEGQKIKLTCEIEAGSKISSVSPNEQGEFIPKDVSGKVIGKCQKEQPTQRVELEVPANAASQY